jgi:hypothetical protein
MRNAGHQDSTQETSWHQSTTTQTVAHGASREWLGLREVTEYADLSERTLRSWIYRPIDALPAVKVCGKVLVRKSDFDTYLQRHRIAPLQSIKIDQIVRDVLQGASHGR